MTRAAVLLPVACSLLSAQPQLRLKSVSVAVLRNGVQVVGPAVEATVRDTIELLPVLEVDAGGVRYFADAEKLMVGGRRVRASRFERGLPKPAIEFLDISPVMRFYRGGVGAPPVVFVERKVGNGWRHRLAGKPGTYRFRVRARLAGQEVSTPGAGKMTAEGLPGAPRISIREDKGGGDNIDYMTMFFNVAFVYGSVRRQVENFTGADCQDMVIYGLNRTGQRLSYDRHIHAVRRDRMTFDGLIDQQGQTYNLKGRRVDVSIRRGDVIRYADFAHYAAVYEDRSAKGPANGKLDLRDRVIQTLGEPAIRGFDEVFGFTGPTQRIQVFRFQ
jgi:hypothetical protein